VRRGEIWTVAGGPDYARKPRPMIIIQANEFSETATITLCGLTTTATEGPLGRLVIAPSALNGLRSPSHVMVDKIASVAKSKLGYRLGRLDHEDITRLNSHLKIFLDLA
jgi:mRNA interferase MazF